MIGPAKWIARGILVAGLVGALVTSPAHADDVVRILSNRYPATEFYTKAMQEALPGVKVEVTLMPVDKVLEQTKIALSQGGDAWDIVYVNDGIQQLYAKSGWLEPLDELWTKYRAQYKLDDFPEAVLDKYRYGKTLYAMPFNGNTMLFFYRADLFREKGLKPPASFDEYLKAAQALHSPSVAGTAMSLKPVDAAQNEVHWYFNALGAQWFDDKWKPTFNSPAGVKAIETMRAVSRFAPAGFTSHANDETTVNFQQGRVAMGIMWNPRAKAMDDPTKSQVVGKIDWVAPPGGGTKLALDGYAISRFSKKNKDMLFRIMAIASDEAHMRQAADISAPVRNAVLSDTELAKKYRFYPALLATLKVARPLPPLPEFPQVGEIVTRHVVEVVTSSGPVKPALDAAAKEVEDVLRKRGYYR
jgi:ABC-type glycerol-3-phosphate transport system substrate-binding protein